MWRKTFIGLLGMSLALTTPAAATAEPAEQVTNGGFDAGTAPWWWTSNAPGAVVDGRLCATVPGGTVNPWDAIIGQNEIDLEAGQSYKFAFTASASTSATVRANVQLADPPYTAELSQQVPLTSSATRQEYEFTSTVTTAKAQVAFQIGGNADSFDFCVDDVSLAGGSEPPPYIPDTGPRVRVNQTGYLPSSAKHATLVTTATEPVAWRLSRPDGTVAASGNSKPRGIDPTSRQNTHTIDFSRAAPGKGYTLSADGETSVPFDIGGEFYQRLKTDSLAFFYHQRSGTPIEESLVGARYARPAGHLDVPPNQGDTNVACQPGVCDYRLDVRGGWYDAGDHGKYVVNGGISVAQLMSEFERSPRAFGDGNLRIPERANGVPDILDEARWELEFLLRMQVPAGKPYAGMAHHKIHDNEWTGLPLPPHLDPKLRELHPVSTAATLNLAATAAQCARLFSRYDRKFAARCLTAARQAWAAAKANPAIYASPSDATGGGAYDDTNVNDEFYWAAAELYLTTKGVEYRDAVLSSPVHTADVFTADGFSWQSVAALGRLDLATVPNGLPDRARVRQSVIAGADKYLATARSQAYGLAYAPPEGKYVWGSNSQVLNNLVVLATAYDLTRRTAYRDAVFTGLDYILGRNPLNISYITGYGERDAHNQHHRFWAHQMDAALPNPPAGSLAGGPNSYIQDPVAQDKLKGCADAMCYIDDIGSWATNEVTINWNSALAWVAAFAAEQAERRHE
ncbi:glycoside hydrolase family 9 protein [Kibdelosporangium persicum]|uniref:Non-processive endocellulase n=1 Tax=Kibdelosporangium persicum TaxID=2698649 RepID=A0ABX2F2T2_9PSEU|nr:glycoside hydrolase family 9 protein [Kibdelosporangium persicum]NRN65145.1 Non-processive endocellulase [Kibdelosporangium persicum]